MPFLQHRITLGIVELSKIGFTHKVWLEIVDTQVDVSKDNTEPEYCVISMFVSKKIPYNAVMPESSTVLIVLVNDNQGFWSLIIVWDLCEDKRTSKYQT